MHHLPMYNVARTISRRIKCFDLSSNHEYAMACTLYDLAYAIARDIPENERSDFLRACNLPFDNNQPSEWEASPQEYANTCTAR